jgi:glutathione S-transferase
MQQWLNFISTEIHKGFIPLLYAVAAGKYVDTARPKLMARFEDIDRCLADTPYLMGSAFSVADAYLFALTRWGKADWISSVYNADIDVSALENLRAWFSRVLERPAVQAALGAEQLMTA